MQKEDMLLSAMVIPDPIIFISTGDGAAKMTIIFI